MNTAASVRHDARTYAYEVRNASGRFCCRSDDIEYLCDACRRAVGGPMSIAASQNVATRMAQRDEALITLAEAVDALTARVTALEQWANGLRNAQSANTQNAGNEHIPPPPDMFAVIRAAEATRRTRGER